MLPENCLSNAPGEFECLGAGHALQVLLAPGMSAPLTPEKPALHKQAVTTLLNAGELEFAWQDTHAVLLLDE